MELYNQLPQDFPTTPRLAHQVARRRTWLKFLAAPAEADREFAHLLDEAGVAAG